MRTINIKLFPTHFCCLLTIVLHIPTGLTAMSPPPSRVVLVSVGGAPVLLVRVPGRGAGVLQSLTNQKGKHAGLA